MSNSAFVEVFFDIGWKKQGEIMFFGNNYNIIIKAKVYFEQDVITPEQEKTFNIFSKNKRLKQIETLLMEYSPSAPERFTPQILLFERNGECALLLDDRDEPDDGIAVTIAPKQEVVNQDDYL